MSKLPVEQVGGRTDRPVGTLVGQQPGCGDRPVVERASEQAARCTRRQQGARTSKLAGERGQASGSKTG